MSETELRIGDIIFPEGSARGINQSFDVIDNGPLRRTVNGTLIDTTRAVNRKYSTTISCTDMGIPTITGIWRGTQVEVDSISKFREFFKPTLTTVETKRPQVSGSIVGYDSNGEKVPLLSTSGNNLTFEREVSFVDYNPQLLMMVTSISQDEDEYGAVTSWSIGLEEI